MDNFINKHVWLADTRKTGQRINLMNINEYKSMTIYTSGQSKKTSKRPSDEIFISSSFAFLVCPVGRLQAEKQ